MSYTQKNDWGTSVVVTAMAVLAPLAIGGGGGVDNDSPFGAPKNSSDTGGSAPSFASSGDCESTAGIVVQKGPAATLSFTGAAKMGPKAVIATDAVLEGDVHHAFVAQEGGVFEDLAVAAVLTLPAGADVHAASSLDGYALDGHFLVDGGVRVFLRASAKTAHEMAFLVIGAPVSDGSGFKAEHVLQIPLEQNRVDVTALRDAIAPYQEALHGKVAQVHVFGFEMHLSGGWSVTHEAQASFAIQPDATIEVETSPQ